MDTGIAILFTGLPGSGKSTLSGLLAEELIRRGRIVTLLDGDLVRKLLSSELGFSRADRDLNIRRIAYVASEVVRHRGIAVIAAVAPYDAARKEFRNWIELYGRFLLVYLSASLEVCEKRDPKGLYAKARKGLIASFTGISDVYEQPDDADLTIDTAAVDTERAVNLILKRLVP